MNHELFLDMTFFPANTLGDLMTLDSLFSDARLLWKLGTFLDRLLVGNLDTAAIAVTLLRKRKQIMLHSDTEYRWTRDKYKLIFCPMDLIGWLQAGAALDSHMA